MTPPPPVKHSGQHGRGFLDRKKEGGKEVRNGVRKRTYTRGHSPMNTKIAVTRREVRVEWLTTSP